MEIKDLNFSKSAGIIRGLSPLKPKSRPYKKKIVGFDIETETKKNHFTLGVFTGDIGTITCDTEQQIVQVLNSWIMRDTIVVATNLGFDFLGSLMDYTEYFDMIERNGIIYSFKWYQNMNKKKVIQFYDTTKYWQASVEKMGKFLGMPKLEHPKSFNRKPQNMTEYQELQQYCERDAYISYKFFKDIIIEWINKEKCALKCTISSISLDIFRRNFLQDFYRVENKRAHMIAFKGYYGGRTETIKRGKYYDVNVYDFNSLYASQLRNIYPDPNTCCVAKRSCMNRVDKYEGVSFIKGHMPYKYIPPLPTRSDKLRFTCGKVEGHYSHIELRQAIADGLEIKKFGEGVYYTNTCQPFKKFIDQQYKKRLTQKKIGSPLEIMTKLSMNGLYGKWGFKYMDSSSIVSKDNFTCDMLKGASEFIELGNFIEIKKEDDYDTPPLYSFPIWSCYAAAYARLKLYSYMSKDKYKDNLLYCDTDSLFLANGQKMPHSEDLGKLKHEYQVDKAYFIRPKFYYTTKPKIKGIRTVKTYQEFKRLLKHRNVQEQRFIKYRTALKSQDHHKRGKLKVNEVIEIEKEVSINDDKRYWKLKNIDYEKQEDSRPLML